VKKFACALGIGVQGTERKSGKAESAGDRVRDTFSDNRPMIKCKPKSSVSFYIRVVVKSAGKHALEWGRDEMPPRYPEAMRVQIFKSTQFFKSPLKQIYYKKNSLVKKTILKLKILNKLYSAFNLKYNK
jgi:hypothetical protein